MEALSKMLEALIITLREGIEASLVVGIVFAYLLRTGRPQLKKPVWIGVILAIAASFATAIIIQAVGFDPENERLEGASFFIAAIMVGSLTIWMWRQGKSAKHDIENKLDGMLASDTAKGAAAGSGIGLLLFVFIMILREGFETVLFMLALGGEVTDNPMYNLIGGAIGVSLAAGFGFLLYKGSLRINLGIFFKVTGAVLMILVASLFAHGIHEWTEVEWLPASEVSMAIIGFLTKDSTSAYILMALIGIPAFFIFWEALKIKPQLQGDESDSDRRKSLASASLARRWGVATGALGLSVVMALGITEAAVAAKRHDPSVSPVKAEGDQIVIPAAGLDDGEIHKFTYATEQGDIRFLVLFDGEEFGAAFDSCDICPPKGFLQEGEDTLICKNCNAPVDTSTLADGGGCNPIPLEVTTADDTIIVDLSKLTDPEGGMHKFMK